MSNTVFNKGDRIFAEGDAAANIYILKSGEVTLRRGERDAEIMTVGSAFGISGAGDEKDTYQTSAYVTSDTCEVRLIPTATFRKAMGQAGDDAKKVWSNVISKTVDDSVKDDS